MCREFIVNKMKMNLLCCVVHCRISVPPCMTALKAVPSVMIRGEPSISPGMLSALFVSICLSSLSWPKSKGKSTYLAPQATYLQLQRRCASQTGAGVQPWPQPMPAHADSGPYGNAATCSLSLPYNGGQHDP